MIRFRCPRCDKKFKTQQHFAGRQTECPRCGSLVDVPHVSQDEPQAVPSAAVQPAPRGPDRRSVGSVKSPVTEAVAKPIAQVPATPGLHQRAKPAQTDGFAIICDQCTAEVHPDANHCPRCGNVLGGQGQAAPGPSAPTEARTQAQTVPEVIQLTEADVVPAPRQAPAKNPAPRLPQRRKPPPRS